MKVFSEDFNAHSYESLDSLDLCEAFSTPSIFSCSAFRLTLSKLIANRIYLFMTSFDEYFGNSKLKKQVSAPGSLWSPT